MFANHAKECSVRKDMTAFCDCGAEKNVERIEQLTKSLRALSSYTASLVDDPSENPHLADARKVIKEYGS